MIEIQIKKAMNQFKNGLRDSPLLNCFIAYIDFSHDEVNQYSIVNLSLAEKL